MIKKIICSICISLAFSSAYAGTYTITNNKGVNYNFDTTYPIVMITDMTDVELAINVGNVSYLKNALNKDPNLIKKINDLNYGDFLGSRIGNVETLKLLLQYDPNLLNRKDSSGRNILLSNLFYYYEVFTDKTVIQIMKDTEIETAKKIPQLGKNFTKDKDVKEFESLIVTIISSLNEQQLNTVDIFKNTALHYATYNRNLTVIEELLKNKNFKIKNNLNMYNENSLFMLLGINCNIVKNKDKDISVLDKLLSAGISPLDKNNKRISFASIVSVAEEYKGLNDLAWKFIPENKMRIANFEADLLKRSLSKMGKDKNLHYSLFSVNYNLGTNVYNAYLCSEDNTKK